MNNYVLDLDRYFKLKEQNKIDRELDAILQDLCVGKFVFAMQKLTNVKGKINKLYMPILKEVVKIETLKEMREHIEKEMKELKSSHNKNNVEMNQLKANKKAAKAIIKEIDR